MRAKRPRTSGRRSRVPKGLVPGAIGAGVAALAAAPAAHAATFNVTNLNDNGAGSLRQAIIDANTAAGADVVTFQSGLTGTITLTTGQLYIEDSVDIQGPGAAVITVSGNNSSRVFYMYSSSATLDVRIAGLTITNGTASIGAGVVDFDENLTLDGVVITGNQAQGDGGGLWADGFSMNLTIRNSTISGNTAASDGGGIYVEDTGGPLLIENCVITGNDAADDGGGIYFYDPDDDVTIRDTTISGNTASGSGGGVYFYDTDGGQVRIERSTVTGNQGALGGGFFFYGLDNPLTIENTTITGNTATEAGGGGIYFYSLYAATTLSFVTVAGNSAAGDGGGVASPLGLVGIQNSIIADNTAAADADLSSGSEGEFDVSFSLIETPGAANITDNGGNILNQDPQLAALASNGGPTQTMRPALTSPVVNVADPATTVTTDQRGQPREYPTRADMGALELVGGVLQFNPTTYSVAENGGSVMLTVVRDVGPDPASAGYTTNSGTATPGVGNDYTTTAGTLNFAPGDLSESFNVPILDDTTIEGSEQFTATISNPSVDATIGAANTATVTITDFEPGQVQLSNTTYSVSESTPGFVTITVNRVNGSNGPAAVNYTTTPGSATPGAGNDYTTTSGVLNWADNDSAPKSFNVPILDDNAAEGNETFTVSLNTPSGATLGSPGSATVTITDDPAGTAQFSVATMTTPEEAGSVTVTVTRTGGTEGPLSVSYTTNNGTATAPSDYTPAAGIVTFPAGSATSQAFNITIVDDNLNEVDEMFTVNLSGANVGSPSTLAITIAQSDADVPALSWFGKILLTLMTGVVGLYAMVRNRFTVVLFAMMLAGIAAAPTLSAAQVNPKTNAAEHKKEAKGGKVFGTLTSVTKNESTVVLNLTGGLTLTLPTKNLTIVDTRKPKRTPGTLQQVVAGANVVVKFKKDPNTGEVTSAKIKLR